MVALPKQTFPTSQLSNTRGGSGNMVQNWGFTDANKFYQNGLVSMDNIVLPNWPFQMLKITISTCKKYYQFSTYTHRASIGDNPFIYLLFFGLVFQTFYVYP